MTSFYKRQSGYVWDGEPKLCMTANGADWEIRGGQPVMDAGLENWALYSMFTKPGWWGNYAIKGPYRHGEDCEFDDVTEQPLSRSSLIAGKINGAPFSNQTTCPPKADASTMTPRSGNTPGRIKACGSSSINFS